jgi:3-hydroxy-9,10-secoandrosta-1,3,5(10)-triene-9,17-dione monooxygenase
VLGAAEKVVELYQERVRERVLAYSGVAQKDQPAAQIRLGDARVRLRALSALVADTAAHTVHESRAIIADLLEASGASAQFLSNPLQRAKRDVDIAAGHVVFDYDLSRELSGALSIGAAISPLAMI